MDNLKAGGFDVTPIRTETRCPSDSEAPADRFDAEDSAQARTAASQVMAFATTMTSKQTRYRYDLESLITRFRANRSMAREQASTVIRGSSGMTWNSENPDDLAANPAKLNSCK